MRDHVFLQGVEQFGIRRRVARADVVDRVDDSSAQEIAPNSVGDRPGEEGIVGRGHPFGELLATSDVAANLAGMLVRKQRRDDMAVLGMEHFARVEVVNDLFSFAPAPFDADAAPKGGQTVILALGPFLKRVIVALVAGKANAEEQLRGVFERDARFLGLRDSS